MNVLQSTDRGRFTVPVGPWPTPPSRMIVAVAGLMVLWCLGFAAVNVAFEVTGHFRHGPLAAYGPAISIMDWLVVVLKAVGAAVVVLSVTGRSLLPPRLLTVLIWGAFAMPAGYSVGNLAHTVTMVFGPGVGVITWRDGAYVLFFAAAAVGLGILAVSYLRRSGTPARYAVIGACLGPLGIGILLGVVPALLAGLGIMPA